MRLGALTSTDRAGVPTATRRTANPPQSPAAAATGRTPRRSRRRRPRHARCSIVRATQPAATCCRSCTSTALDAAGGRRLAAVRAQRRTPASCIPHRASGSMSCRPTPGSRPTAEARAPERRVSRATPDAHRRRRPTDSEPRGATRHRCGAAAAAAARGRASRPAGARRRRLAAAGSTRGRHRRRRTPSSRRSSCSGCARTSSCSAISAQLARRIRRQRRRDAEPAGRASRPSAAAPTGCSAPTARRCGCTIGGRGSVVLHASSDRSHVARRPAPRRHRRPDVAGGASRCARRERRDPHAADAWGAVDADRAAARLPARARHARRSRGARRNRTRARRARPRRSSSAGSCRARWRTSSCSTTWSGRAASWRTPSTRSPIWWPSGIAAGASPTSTTRSPAASGCTPRRAARPPARGIRRPGPAPRGSPAGTRTSRSAAASPPVTIEVHRPGAEGPVHGHGHRPAQPRRRARRQRPGGPRSDGAGAGCRTSAKSCASG